MGKGKRRHDPNKYQNQLGTSCRFCERIPMPDDREHIHCEIGYSTKFCQGNPHKCKKAWYSSMARRSDKRKNIDNIYIKKVMNMIKKIDYNIHLDKDGYPLYYTTKNPLFKPLPQYHFDRDDMCEIFDSEFMEWFWDHLGSSSDEFLITRNDDEFYIIHFLSGTIINWYKHMGRTNTCNKDLTLDDLREFKKMLLDSFGYEEVK